MIGIIGIIGIIGGDGRWERGWPRVASIARIAFIAGIGGDRRTGHASDVLSRTALASVSDAIADVRILTQSIGRTTGLPDIIRTGDRTPPTDNNLLSARRAYNDFLAKNQDDTAAGHIRFLRGFTGGRMFTEGWFGVGSRLEIKPNGKTHFTVDELTVRDSLETMLLRFNAVDVIAGEQWQTFAFGTAASAEPGDGTGIPADEGVCYIDLLDGELLLFKPGDIVRGIFHNIAPDGTADNPSASGNDACGFPQVAGFSTAYLTPLHLVDAEGNETTDILAAKGFRYRLRPGTTMHPCASMRLVAYGSFTDPERRATTFATTRRLIMMEGVDTWTIDPTRHYSYIRGDLNNIEIGETVLEGHGTMQNRSYLFGPMIRFTKEQLKELRGEPAYTATLSTYGAIFPYGNNTGNTVHLTTQLQVLRGPTPLTEAAGDIPGEGTYTATLDCRYCTAYLSNGIITVTSLGTYSADLRPGFTVTVNCEGEAVLACTYVVTPMQKGADGNPDISTMKVAVQRVDRSGPKMLDALEKGQYIIVDEVEPQGVSGGRYNYAAGITLEGIRMYGATEYKFSLYDAAGRLIDRESVPVVRDGKQGADGKQGLPGLRVRLRKELVQGKTYRNDEGVATVADPDAGGFVDFLALRCSAASATSGYAVFRVKKGIAYNSSYTVPATARIAGTSISNLRSLIGSDADYWEVVDSNLDTGFFNFLVAKGAFIDILSGTQFLINDAGNRVVGGMQGSSSNLPVIWAGASADDADKAPVRIYAATDADGEPTGRAYIEGKVVSGKAGGQRVELDPDGMDAAIYGADGNLCAKLTGNAVNISGILSGNSMGVSAVGTTTRTLNTSGETVVWSPTIAIQAPGIIRFTVTNKEFKLTKYGSSGGSGLQQEARGQLLARVLVTENGVERQIAAVIIANVVIPDDTTSASIKNGTYTISVPVEAGKRYKLVLTPHVAIGCTYSGSITYAVDPIAEFYRAEFGKDGMAIAVNSRQNFILHPETASDNSKKLVNIRNGVRQPYTVLAANVSSAGVITFLTAPPGFNTTTPGDAAYVGNRYSKNAVGQWYFNLGSNYTHSNLIVNVTPIGWARRAQAGPIGYGNGCGISVQLQNSNGNSDDGGFYIEIKTI